MLFNSTQPFLSLNLHLKRLLRTGRQGTLLCLALLSLSGMTSWGQAGQGNWTEIVGKQVVDQNGVILGYVRDTAIDLERGRYFGVLVSAGGIFGGGKMQVVPPGALIMDPDLKTIHLNMSKAQFRNAPNCALSEDRGAPNVAKATEVYRYFGQTPYFAPVISQDPKSVQLGYVMEGTRILKLPVENLQGKSLGTVQTLMFLDSRTGRFTGVVVGEKIVPPEALRYNFDHTVLRINNHEESFSQTAAMKVSSNGTFTRMGTTARPGNPRPPLQQGNSARDKAITAQITDRISSSLSLSHYARNIQVGTVQGKTTVRGRVQSQKEKNQIEGFAIQAAGAGQVENLLEVRPITARDKAVDQDL